MGWIEAIVRYPVKVTVGVILVVMFGLIAIFRMPIQLIPEVQVPTITVETRWPGASPQEVEREIVLEQEEQLQTVEGVTKMSSESSNSQGRIMLEFPVGSDLNVMLTKVSTRLKQVREMPVDADEPVVTAASASDRPIAWFILFQKLPDDEKLASFQAEHPELAAELEQVRKAFNPGLAMYRLKELVANHPEAAELLPPEIDITSLRRFCEDVIEARFERAQGVSQANVIGGREDELQVIVDPQRLAARQITIADLRNALSSHNKDTSAGDFWEGKRRWIVRTLSQYRSPEQVANVVVASRDGRPVYVRDVADVQIGFKKPDGVMLRYATPVIGLNAMRETGSNVLEVMESLRQAVTELNERVLKPRGLQLAQVYDETEYIHSSIDLVWENISEGAVLTFIVLLLFLRSFRSALVVFVSIAVSIVGMFLMMLLMGRTLNVPSLAGIAFAVGMLVDNFIVVLENAHRHRQAGKDPFSAAVYGLKDVWGAVLVSTLANLAVFIPILFVQDEAGQLFRDIALATASALALSLLVALTVVPTAAARVLGAVAADPLTHAEQPPEEPQHWHRFDRVRLESRRLADRLLIPLDAFGSRFISRVTKVNTWVQETVGRRAVLTLGMVGVSVLLSWMLMPKLEYLPAGNRNLVFGTLLPPPGYNVDHLENMGHVIEQRLRPYWDVDPGSPEIDKLDYPAIADLFYVVRGRMLIVGLRAQDPLRAGELVPLVQSVTGDLPGTMVAASQSSLFERGLGAGRSIDVDITGPDIRDLVALGGQVLGKSMALIPGAQAIPKPSLDLSAPEMHILPKVSQAADMQVNSVDLGYAVDALVDGAYATDYYMGGDKIDLSIVGDRQFASRTQDLASLPIALPGGGLARLDAVADIQFSSGPEQINRRERQRAITIQVVPPASVPLEEAMNRIEADIIQPLRDAGQLGGLYDISLSGTADKLKLAWRSLRWNLLLAFVITYLVMAALFESWLFPLVIILSVPLGAVGGFAGLQLLNLWGSQFGFYQSLDVLTMLGFIILVGTVVNNPILIVEQALNFIREEGMPLKQAVVESVRTRIRPIFMTALIGFFGLLPLVVSPGAGSELYRGLGAVLLGGLLVSTIFTLFLVPALFSLAMEAKDMLGQLVGRLLDRRADAPVIHPGVVSTASLVAAGVPLDMNHLSSAVGSSNGNGPHAAGGNGSSESQRVDGPRVGAG